MIDHSSSVTLGARLRHWRQIRGVSQLKLATAADISAKHLSFVETGRAQPSRAMVLRLCDALSVPARERKLLLNAAGFAAELSAAALEQPGLADIRLALDRFLAEDDEVSRLAVDPRHHGIIGCDQSGRFVAWNEQMELISGRSAAEVVGQNVADLFPFTVETGEKTFMDMAARGHEIVVHDRPFRIPELNRQGFSDNHHLPLRSPKGTILCGLTVTQDVTVRHQRDEALRQLQSARGAAEDIVNGINDLLTVVAGSLEMLESIVGEGRSRALVSLAGRAIGRCGALTEQLLETSAPWPPAQPREVPRRAGTESARPKRRAAVNRAAG